MPSTTFRTILVAALVAAGAGSAAQPATTATPTPTVRVTPSTIERGHSLTVTGRHWPRSVRVQLLIGPPRSEADPVGSVRTTVRGSFRRSLRISASSPLGLRVMLACRRDCRDKATVSFTVTR